MFTSTTPTLDSPLLASPRKDQSQCSPQDSVMGIDTMRPLLSRLLIVEDDEGDSLLVLRALKSYCGSFEISISPTLSDALELMSQQAFDLILLDLSLPDNFGLQGLSRIREQSQQTPIVVLTGLDDHCLALQAIELGAQDYLVKGEWSQESLGRTIRYAVQRQQVIAENQRLLEEIQRQARYDSLTSVLNRQSFEAEFEREWARSTRLGTPLSCAMIDVDYFKKVNDMYGHAAGDDVLRVVSKQIQQMSRATDFVGRYGGEEFCVVLPDTDEMGAVMWAERLRGTIEAFQFSSNGNPLSVTVSLGVAQRHLDSLAPHVVLEMADGALLKAKRIGRNRVVSHGQIEDNRGLPNAFFSDRCLGARVEDVMTPCTGAVSMNGVLSDVSHFIIETGFNAAPIVNEDGEIMGIITDDDLLREVQSPRGWNAPVVDVMNKRAECLSVGALTRDVLDLLQRNATRHVFFLENKRVVGSIDCVGLVRFFRERALTV